MLRSDLAFHWLHDCVKIELVTEFCKFFPEPRNVDAGRYVYDLNITSGAGDKTRVVEGQAIVTPGVTR